MPESDCRRSPAVLSSPPFSALRQTESLMEANHSAAGVAPTDPPVFEVPVQNHSSPFADVELLQKYKPLIVPCYALVLVLGVCGNYLLIYVICRTRKLHTVTNLFILNLAVSDLLMCVTCVPFTLAYALNPRGWTFGRSACYAVFTIQPLTVYVSVFTLTAIAVDRCSATVRPLKKRTSVAACAVAVAGIWLASVALVTPAALHTYHVEFRDQGFTICEEFWFQEETRRRAYAYGTLLLTYVLPLSALSASYVRISLKLRKCVAPGNRTLRQSASQQARSRRIFRLVVLLVSAFAVSWMPIHVFNVLRDIDIDLIDKRRFLLIQVLCHLCAMSSSCCNPALYAWLHHRFRAELRKTLSCRRHRVGGAKHGTTPVVL